MKNALLFVSICLSIAAPLKSSAQLQPSVDYGDHKSSTLTSKAWEALNQGNLDAALSYVSKCISMYEAEAKTMQASLSAYPATEPKEEAFKYWALNDVGTCYFIKGEVLLKKSDRQGAIAAFEACSRDFSYCQCWDPRGWFWRPGQSAKQKVVELNFDAQ